ncbi:MAG: TerC family protein [Hyphomicrobiales bacterium]|nr:TerC family protein [Hyphomicrobiales bacterium]|tara:strand:- start:258 stop:938 length:681 start_codon:yes stop_codon:yes gene_type:complete
MFESIDFIPILQIIWIDLLLSGDNAIIIALACRGLPEKQKKIGLFFGVTTAIVLRILFASVITLILDMPFIRTIGGILLIWIAIKLILPQEENQDDKHGEAKTLWKVIFTIAVADAAMSLDNVLAVAAAAHGSIILIIFGILFSIPLLFIGSSFLLKIFTKFPVLIWFGGGLLGWIAGHLLFSDIGTQNLFTFISEDYILSASVACSVIVIVTAKTLTKLKENRRK